ncbi:P-loop containing nucleoside triphosphate hydrolase protein [Chytridium lagenaria]|nr:P-loop containing nucleoside triphosphate hydrolase protein [Chytridium lagenaria]
MTGGGRNIPQVPEGSENDPSLKFTTLNVTLPRGAGLGCYIAPGLAVGIPLDPNLVLTCDPGWYCPNLDPANSTTLPVYCPPSAGCAAYRLGSMPCTPQGRFEPRVCKQGFYCPTYRQMLPCPPGYFCTTAVVMGICDVILFFVIITLKLRQGAFKSLTPGPLLGRMFRGPAYALEMRAKAANDATEEPTFKVEAAAAVKTADMETLIRAFHSAMGHRELRMNFKFDNLALSIKGGKKVLEGVTGEIKSKRMTAIMGPSGAGSENHVYERPDGQSSENGGRLYINGAEAEVHLYRKIIGYVPQEDIMLRELTVREVVLHSARVRLPRTWTSKQIEDHVDNVLQALNLAHVANSYIGDETTRGISGGQRKRVNIGMELAAGSPPCIFLDEPTSGLDATAALEVCDILSEIARLGLTSSLSSINQESNL